MQLTLDQTMVIYQRAIDNLDGHDDAVLRNLNSKKQISPAGLATVLNCSRGDAKLILQRMAGRGILRGHATGWFEKAEWNAAQLRG